MNANMTINARIVSVLLVGVLFAVATALAVAPVNQSWRGIALKGYDPVAYFKELKPVKGSSSFTHEWNGATFRFSSAENRDLFAAAPKKFAPQYGGYCAWAVSQGYTAPIDPSAWRIVDDKLYLNYSQSVQKEWQKDIAGNIAKADKNWPKILADE